MKLKNIPTIITVILFFAGAIVSGGTGVRELPDRALLTGVWLDHKAKVVPGDCQPQLEFMSDGRFRSQSQIGEVHRGSWRWKSADTLELRFVGKGESTFSLNLEKLTSRTLVLSGRQSTEYIRLKAWRTGKPARQE